jgi:hypothetical protein
VSCRYFRWDTTAQARDIASAVKSPLTQQFATPVRFIDKPSLANLSSWPLTEATFEMFDVEICQPRQIVLVRFRGELNEHDFSELDKMASDVRGKAEYDCIYDMTDIEKVSLRIDFVAKRADFPQPYKNRERIYVVQEDDLKFLVGFLCRRPGGKGMEAAENGPLARRGLRHIRRYPIRVRSSSEKLA